MASAKSTKSTGAGKTTGKAAGTGKSSSTSKTAHVMNLLRKSNVTETPPPVEATPAVETSAAPVASVPAVPAPAPAAQAPAEQVAAQPSAPQPPAQHVHPLITSIKEEAEVSDQIRNALEDALLLEEQEEAAPPKPQPSEPPVKKAPPPPPPVEEPEEEPDEEDDDSFEEYVAQPIEREPVPQPRLDVRPPMTTMQPAAPPPQSKPQPQPAPAPAPAPTPAPQSGIVIPDSPVQVTNVMEILVDQKADKYMDMFGVCNCPRCRVDVRAIALNNLPPKYVTLRPEERNPRLTIYENRFNSAVIAQLLRACTQVLEAPHHDQW